MAIANHEPDLRTARRHLELLTEEVDPVVSWQLRKDASPSRGDRGRALHGRLEDVLPELRAGQAEGYGVFIAVNATDGKGVMEENVTACRALFLDLDGAELPDRWPVKPAFVVEAAAPCALSHYQCWWPHEGSGRFEHWQHLQAALATRYGGSKHTKVTALARCAGFWNLSNPRALFQVSILEDHGGDGDYTLPWDVPSLARAFGIELPAAVGALPHRVGGLSWRQASEVQQRSVEWLWPGRIALGKLTGIAGLPDQGKSQLTAAIAAAVTTGGAWPDGGHAPKGSVIILSAEDDPSDTTVPRLQAAGADLSRVRLLNALVETSRRKRMFNLAGDLHQLGELLAQTPEARLLIIDPVTAYLGSGSVNTFRNSDVRAVLSPVAEFAAEHGVAVLLVTHFTKSGKGSAISRVTDSGAFTALSRIFWAVVPEVEDGRTTGRKLMVQIKNNIGGQIPGLAFTFEDVRLKGDVATSRIIWNGEVELTADDALSGSASTEVSPMLDRAAAFLSETLAEGPVLSAQIEAGASEAGISIASLRRARERLGVTSYQVNREWWQKLPQGEVETE